MNMTKVLTHHSGDSLSFEFRDRMCPDIQRELGVEPRGGLDLRKPPGPLGGFPDTPNKGEDLGRDFISYLELEHIRKQHYKVPRGLCNAAW